MHHIGISLLKLRHTSVSQIKKTIAFLYWSLDSLLVNVMRIYLGEVKILP